MPTKQFYINREKKRKKKLNKKPNMKDWDNPDCRMTYVDRSTGEWSTGKEKIGIK